MDNRLYSIGIALTKKENKELLGEGVPSSLRAALTALLNKERARGAALCLFDGHGARTLAMGEARYQKGTPVRADTYFRIASLSKLVTAYGALTMAASGALSLDADIGEYLGFKVRNPLYPSAVITLWQLLSHTASIKDGESYNRALTNGAALSSVLAADSFYSFAPKTRWEYSNLGAGMIGCAMEKAADVPFDRLMEKIIFEPLRIKASYYPQRIEGMLADAWRLFPPAGKANYDALARQNRPDPGQTIDIEHDYLLAHGSLIITAPDLARIMQAIHAQSALFDEMRTIVAPFGERDKTLSQGLGMFIYQENTRQTPLYGHQGLAYGAVHGAFMDEEGRGYVILTSAVSEKRRGVLNDMNRALCALLFKEDVWKL